MDEQSLADWLTRRIADTERAYVESGRDEFHRGAGEAFKMVLHRLDLAKVMDGLPAALNAPPAQS